MLFNRFLLTICTILVATGTAANVSLTELIPLIPACALNCIISGLSQSPEALSDPTSTCKNVTLQASLSSCVQGLCNATEQAQVGDVNEKLCEGVEIDESRVWAVVIVAVVCGPLALIAIALRTYSRYSITKTLGIDEWVMLVAGAVLVALIVMDIQNGFVNGFGRHYWNIDTHRVVPLLKTFYVGEVLYILVITLVKSSILLFYLRVFPTRWFRVADLILLGLVVISGIGIIIPIIFQCNPVAGAWDPTLESTCINIHLLAYATGGIAVGFDVVILALPIPELISLKMNRKKKIHVSFMFSLGIVACVTSIVRLKYLVDFSRSTDAPWDNALPALWSLLEICVAIICACLPALRALFSRWLPIMFNNDTTAYINDITETNTKSYTSQGRSRSEKGGLSSNSRAVETPEQELLDHISSKGGKPTTRVWVNPRFDEHGNVLSEDMSIAKPHSPPSSDNSLFVLEGPRESDEHIDILMQKGDIPMQDFRGIANRTNKTALVETSTA